MLTGNAFAPDSPVIVIGGGVGPMAGVFLHRKLILNTPGVTGDHDHLPVIHISYPSRISDRTGWLLSRNGPNPGAEMAELLLEWISTDSGSSRRILIGVPCNTFHSKDIFNVFKNRLEESAPGKAGRLVVVDMIGETTGELCNTLAPGSAVGILCTNGTRESGLWRNAVSDCGLNPAEPPPDGQQRIHEAIYNPEWGLKAVYPATIRAAEAVAAEIQKLKEAGAAAVILGCTELPLCTENIVFDGIHLVDPLDCLAGALVDRFLCLRDRTESAAV